MNHTIHPWAIDLPNELNPSINGQKPKNQAQKVDLLIHTSIELKLQNQEKEKHAFYAVQYKVLASDQQKWKLSIREDPSSKYWVDVAIEDDLLLFLLLGLGIRVSRECVREDRR